MKFLRVSIILKSHTALKTTLNSEGNPRVEIPLKNRSRYERFERFFRKIWAVWAVLLDKPFKNRSNRSFWSKILNVIV